MRCPKPCGTPMERDGATHTCLSCGRVVTLSDPGYLPSAGYVPSPYRTPAEPFAPLPDELREEEKGWPQTGPSVYDAAVKRPHPARLPETDPANIAWRQKLQAAARESASDPDVRAARSAGQHRRHKRKLAQQEAVKQRYRDRTAGTWYGRGAA